MSVPRSPGPTALGQTTSRTANHSIGFYFFACLIVPISILILLWGLVAAALVSGHPHRWRWLQLMRSSSHILASAAVISGTGIAVAVVAVVLMGVFARRVTRVVDGQAADAIASQHRSTAAVPAVDAAVAAEAALRGGFSQILSSLGKRNQSLLHRQLRIIDTLEQQAASPEALADLFALDHLTTRMRRHAESLTILAGASPARSWNGPVPVIDVLRAAAAEVEDYTRVSVISQSDEAVTASVVIDVIHLLAELIENATLFSPSSTRVEVRTEHVANGFVIEVEDRGLGIPPDQLRELNAQLASPPDFDSADADRLGLFVVARLAARHGVHVSLSPSPYLGTKAVVVLPGGVVIPAPDTAGQPVSVMADHLARLNLHAPEVLSLADAVTASAPVASARLQVGTLPNPRLAPSASAPSASAPSASAPVVKGAAETPAITLHGLPRRVRPDAQAQDARAADPGAEPGADAPAARKSPVESPAPDAARNLAASLQSSWQRSRQGDDRPGAAQAPDSAPESEA
jgi:signal transduction histidine kinase